MTRNITVFAVAALLEIAGCFAFWSWLRRGATPFFLVLGVASLIGFAFALTRVDSAFAGRAYAAYGGIYIAALLLWLWLVEGQIPTRTDLRRSRTLGKRNGRRSLCHAETPRSAFDSTSYGVKLLLDVRP